MLDLDRCRMPSGDWTFWALCPAGCGCSATSFFNDWCLVFGEAPVPNRIDFLDEELGTSPDDED